MVYELDAIVAMADGLVTHFGPADKIIKQLPAGTEVKNYGKDSLISAGFIDSYVHFPQTPMIATYGEQLLDWLNKYTFPTEEKYAGPGHDPHLHARRDWDHRRSRTSHHCQGNHVRTGHHYVPITIFERDRRDCTQVAVKPLRGWVGKDVQSVFNDQWFVLQKQDLSSSRW